jgi:ribosomal protein S27AE
MKIKKSQLKEAVKAVVRQCLSERVTEGCSSGSNKRFKGKEGRMFKHVEDSEKEQGKSTKVAKKIAGATVNKRRADEQVGADVVAGENMGSDASQSPMDDIVRHVIEKVPAIANNPQKVARVAGLLFQRQFGGQQPPDQETLLGLVQKHIGGGSEEQAECGGMEEAGLTSETGAESSEGYDEKEEIMLIKVMALIAKKLEDMHAGMPGAGPSDEPSAVTVGGEEEPSFGDEEPAEEPSASPFGGSEEEPSFGDEEPEEKPAASPFGGSEEPEEKPESEEPSEPKEPKKSKKDDKKDKKKEPPIKEGSAKTQTQAYRVAPNPSVLTQKTDDEKLKPKDPRLTETSLTKAGKTAVSYKTQGASYKVAPNPSCRVKTDDKDRREPEDPELTEDKEYSAAANNSCPRCGTVLANKSGKLRCDNPDCMHSRRGHSFKSGATLKEPKIKENHRVQTRSYVTVNDKPNDPNVMRDPENPYSNGA